jgi:hypothetical protein
MDGNREPATNDALERSSPRSAPLFQETHPSPLRLMRGLKVIKRPEPVLCLGLGGIVRELSLFAGHEIAPTISDIDPVAARGGQLRTFAAVVIRARLRRVAPPRVVLRLPSNAGIGP